MGFLKNHFHAAVALLFLILGFLIYFHALKGTFEFDDYFVIVNNSTIRKLDLPIIWEAFRTRFVIGLSLALNYYFSGMNTFGYHVFNVFVHFFCSLSVYFLAFYILKTPYFKDKFSHATIRWIAFFSGLLFLTHPLQTQAVSYIWQRGASMTALFYVSAVMFYLKSRVEHRKSAFFLCILSIVLGMHTKENSATVPITIVIAEVLFFGAIKEDFKRRVLRLIPVLACLLIIPLHMTQANEVQLDLLRSPLYFNDKSEDLTFLQKLSMVTRWANPQDMPRLDYMLTQANVIRTYIRLLFLPIHQNLDYDFPITKSFFEIPFLFSFSLILLILFFAFYFGRKSHLLLFCVIWFFLNLLIESSVPMKDVIFEHRVYLPGVGFFLAVPYYMFVLFKQRKEVFYVLGGICLILSVMTFQRNKVWETELTLWHDVLKKSPNKARPHVEIGAAYGRLGNIDKVIEHNLRAIELDPFRALAYGNVGYGYYEKGDLKKALKYYHEAFKFQEYLPWVANNMSVAYRDTGRLLQALYWSKKAVELNPWLASSYSNLGYHYFLTGQVEQAIVALKKGIELDPAHAPLYMSLAIVYFKTNQMELAEQAFQNALKTSEDPAYIYNNWGTLFMGVKNWDKAVYFMQKALERVPDLADAHFNLGVIYANKHQFEKAMKELKYLESQNRNDLSQRLSSIIDSLKKSDSN